jgi:hypothetical protein
MRRLNHKGKAFVAFMLGGSSKLRLWTLEFTVCCSSAECQHPNTFVVATFRQLRLLAWPDAVLELQLTSRHGRHQHGKGSKNSYVPCPQNRTHSATLMRPLMK